MESRKVIIEIAEMIEKSGKEQEVEARREQGRLEQLEIEVSLELVKDVEKEKLKKVEETAGGKHISKEQDIRIMLTRQIENSRKEQEKQLRLEIGARKKADLLEKLKPENWLRTEASRVILEIVRSVEQSGMDKTIKMKDQKDKEQSESKSKRGKSKRPPPWLTKESKKVVDEIVKEVERKGRLKTGEQKKRQLLEKL